MNAMHARTLENPSRQKGVALIVSMLMLLILTLMGVSGMMYTMLEEKMSGNQRDRNLAFQAAESALRQGETDLEGYLSKNPVESKFNCTDANTCPSLADVTAKGTWGEGTKATTYSGKLTNLASSPQYLIEAMFNGNPVDIYGIDPLSAGASKTLLNSYCYYRITARGVGGTSSAVVIVQSNYIHPPIKGVCHG